jgi:hypothetical protein
MSETPNLLEQRIKQCEDALGIAGITSPATKSLAHYCAVNSVVITTTATPPSFGTWVLLDTGNNLGGQVGTVYVYKRTA